MWSILEGPRAKNGNRLIEFYIDIDSLYIGSWHFIFIVTQHIFTHIRFLYAIDHWAPGSQADK